jgi:hypothetical protein
MAVELGHYLQMMVVEPGHSLQKTVDCRRRHNRLRLTNKKEQINNVYNSTSLKLP